MGIAVFFFILLGRPIDGYIWGWAASGRSGMLARAVYLVGLTLGRLLDMHGGGWRA